MSIEAFDIIVEIIAHNEDNVGTFIGSNILVDGAEDRERADEEQFHFFCPVFSGVLRVCFF